MKSRFLCFVFSIIVASVATAEAGVTLTFQNITGNNAGDAQIGETQLLVSLAPGPGANQVSFTFTNTGPANSSITKIYFEDGAILGIATIDDSDPGVDYMVADDQNPNLPGSNNVDPPFQASAGFTQDSGAEPVSQGGLEPNGVNPGESVTIVFDLRDVATGDLDGDLDVDIDDVITALNTSPANPGGLVSLRIGVHVQGYDSGGSESFVNIPPDPVPEPSSLVVMGLGAVTLIGLSRRRRRKTRPAQEIE